MWLALLALVFASVTSADDVIVVDVAGQKVTGQIRDWTIEKLSIESSEPKEIHRTDVRSITFADRVPKMAAGAIWLSNGDRIAARAVSVADDVLTAVWPALGTDERPKIALDKVAAIILDLPSTRVDRLRLFADLATISPGADVVLLTNGDRSQGEFQRLDAAFVEVTVAKIALKIDQSRVRAIRFNPELTNVSRSTGRRVFLNLTDGSRLTASQISMVGNEATLKSPELGSLKIPLASIATCDFYGDRIIPITDYEPSKIEFVPYLSATWPLLRNENVLHGALTIRGKEFGTGLGMHSRMSVTYDLKGDEREFQSVVGIDDASNGAGSVQFLVDVDTRRAWTSSEITGKSPSTTVTENVRGAKRMTLTVDYGQFADVSDYANWCDAVFVLERPR